MNDFAFTDKYKKALPNPYNPSGRALKDRVSKRTHVTPEPINRFSGDDPVKVVASRKKHVTPEPVNKFED